MSIIIAEGAWGLSKVDVSLLVFHTCRLRINATARKTDDGNLNAGP